MWQCATIRISDGDWERAGPYTVLIRAGDFGMQIYRNSRSFNVLAGDEGEDDCSDCLVVRKNMKCTIHELNKNTALLFTLSEIYMNWTVLNQKHFATCHPSDAKYMNWSITIKLYTTSMSTIAIGFNPCLFHSKAFLINFM